jgi:hypothetical protein
VSLWALIALLYFFSPFILVVLGWFQEPFSDLGGAESVSHRVHEVLFGVLFAQAMVGAVSQLRNPIGRRAGMLQTVLALVGLVAALAAIGEVELLGIAFVALSMTAMVLHPASRADWKTSWHPQPGLVLLAVSGVLPMVLLAVDNFAKAQVRAADHLTHWGGVAAFAIVQILLALTAALRPPGYRLVAGSVGGAGLLYFSASLLFPFDASARPQFFAAWLFVWSVSWFLVAFTGRPLGSWIAGLGAAGLIAIMSGTGPAGIALGLFLGAVLLVLTRRAEGLPRLLAVGLAILGYFLLVVGGVFASAAGEPPNVPHGLSIGYEAATRQTCMDCHATGAEGATPIPHGTRTCGEDGEECWGGRTDCLGCHRYDPALGGPTQLFPPGLEAGVLAVSPLEINGGDPIRVVGLTPKQLVAAGGLVRDG